MQNDIQTGSEPGEIRLRAVYRLELADLQRGLLCFFRRSGLARKGRILVAVPGALLLGLCAMMIDTPRELATTGFVMIAVTALFIWWWPDILTH